MALLHSPRIATDGLILCLDAANRQSYPGSGNIWRDLAGSNNGTLVNGVGFNSASAGSLVFDGVNDYVSTGLVLPSPSTRPTTFDLIFKHNGINTHRGLIGASNYQRSGFSIGFMRQSQMRNSYNAFGLAMENVWNYNSSVISNGVFVFDGRNLYIYRNGASVISYTASFDVLADSRGIQIGRNLQNGWGFSPYNIYSVKVYNRALTPAEVLQNYNALKGRYNL